MTSKEKFDQLWDKLDILDKAKDEGRITRLEYFKKTKEVYKEINKLGSISG